MIPSSADQGAGAIEDCLAGLLRTSAGLQHRQLRHLIAEAEAHLRDDAEAAHAAGAAVYDAELKAVARFGQAMSLVSAERKRLATPISVLLRQVMLTGLLLGGVGAISVGASGIVDIGVVNDLDPMLGHDQRVP